MQRGRRRCIREAGPSKFIMYECKTIFRVRDFRDLHIFCFRLPLTSDQNVRTFKQSSSPRSHNHILLVQVSLIQRVTQLDVMRRAHPKYKRAESELIRNCDKYDVKYESPPQNESRSQSAVRRKRLSRQIMQTTTIPTISAMDCLFRIKHRVITSESSTTKSADPNPNPNSHLLVYYFCATIETAVECDCRCILVIQFHHCDHN